MESVSLEENSKLGEALLVRQQACCLWWCRERIVSTVQVQLAGVASVLPAASVALTEKVCEPC